jgi:SAM-dependent methyltransferase
MLERAREFSGGRAAFVSLDGITLPFADDAFDFAFSVQMFEHLHRDDALDHLREVRRVLRPGGAYFIVTPNGRFGKSQSEQWGVEGVEEDVHLHEWSYGELRAVAPLCGFDDVRAVRNNDRVQIIPGRLAAVLEKLPSQYAAERIGVATLEAVLR